MASLDEIREKAGAAIDQARPFVEGAMDAGAELVNRADAWASGEHPVADGAFNAVGGAASGAVDAMADGANAAYEFIKDRVEEVSGKDVDGDGLVGKIRREDVVAGAELAAEAVSDKIGKVAGDVAAGAELAVEAAANKVDKVAGDVAAGAELAAEAAADAIGGASE